MLGGNRVKLSLRFCLIDGGMAALRGSRLTKAAMTCRERRILVQIEDFEMEVCRKARPLNVQMIENGYYFLEETDRCLDLRVSAFCWICVIYIYIHSPRVEPNVAVEFSQPMGDGIWGFCCALGLGSRAWGDTEKARSLKIAACGTSSLRTVTLLQSP